MTDPQHARAPDEAPVMHVAPDSEVAETTEDKALTETTESVWMSTVWGILIVVAIGAFGLIMQKFV